MKYLHEQNMHSIASHCHIVETTELLNMSNLCFSFLWSSLILIVCLYVVKCLYVIAGVWHN